MSAMGLDDDPQDQPPMPGCPPNSIAAGTKCLVWAQRKNSTKSGWFPAIIVSGRGVEWTCKVSGRDAVHMTYAALLESTNLLAEPASNFVDGIRDYEIRALEAWYFTYGQKRVLDRSPPLAPEAEGHLHLMRRADDRQRVTRYVGPFEWRQRRALATFAFFPKGGMDALADEDVSYWSHRTKSLVKTWLKNNVEWVKSQHSQIPGSKFVISPGQTKPTIDQFFALSSLLDITDEVAYDTEHTFVVYENYVLVSYFGQLEHMFNQPVDEIEAFAPFKPRVAERPTLRSLPYYE